jgi:hypothetical protein
MRPWSQRLTQIEMHLQALIEGSAARLFPAHGQVDIPAQVVRAMKSAIQAGEAGDLLAPNLYVLTVHPAKAANLLENQSGLQDLALVIQQAGLEAGIIFTNPPVIKVSADPAHAIHEVVIEAIITPPNIGETKSLDQGLANDPGRTIPANAFLIVDGARIFPLNQTVINIGRRVDNHLSLEDPRVSRLHAQLRAINGQYVLFDLNATGGTFINGDRISKASLHPGDVISLAGVLLVFGQDAATFSGDTHGSTRPTVPYPEEG